MKRMFIGLVCALFVVTALVPTSNSASNVNIDGPLTLSVRVQSRHTANFEVCIPVRINEPFRIVWGNETVKSSVTGVVNAPGGDDYSTKLAISEGNGQCRTETEPKLKLDEPTEWSNLVSSLFNHIDTYKFVLSKKACE
jgi:hypothetical protein